MSVRAAASVVAASVVVLAASCGPATSGSLDDDAGAGQGAYEGLPWAARVVDFTPGDGAGHGADKLPDVVLGPAEGAGAAAGNVTDVLSLGDGGRIVLALGVDVVDGDGDDLVVFENAFYFGSEVFAEAGIVSLSLDGEAWATFPCEPDEPAPNGCAGFAPVFKNDDKGDDDTVTDRGGDGFDLAALGIDRARYVRVEDAREGRFGDDGMAGFDLDAVGVVNAAFE